MNFRRVLVVFKSENVEKFSNVFGKFLEVLSGFGVVLGGFHTDLKGFWRIPKGSGASGWRISGPLRKVGSVGKEVHLGK